MTERFNVYAVPGIPIFAPNELAADRQVAFVTTGGTATSVTVPADAQLCKIECIDDDCWFSDATFSIPMAADATGTGPIPVARGQAKYFMCRDLQGASLYLNAPTNSIPIQVAFWG